jgi:TetR/AcrR family transcriptional regulator, transcriptional repressor for nem operon
MARPKEFDVDDALQQALEVFWRKGYEATSVQDLVAAMGIQKASLYGTFGDKHSLYMKALHRYEANGFAALADHLTAAKSPKNAVRSMVLGNAEQACSAKGKVGCFCINANVEMAPQDGEVSDLVRDHSERVEALLEATLRRAKALGEIAKGANTKQLATFLFGVIVALNVLGKQRAGRDRMLAMARQSLAALDG